MGGFVALGFTVFSFRLIELQVARSDYYKALAFEKHSVRQPIHARRGGITDVNGVPLASNEPVKTVVVDASVVRNPDALAETLSRHLEMPLAGVRERLNRKVASAETAELKPSRYIVIKHEVSETVAETLLAEIESKRIRGMFFEQDAVRVYPNGSMLSHVVGYVNRENKGMEGVERSMDEWLKGHDGFRYTERNRRGSEMVAFRWMESPARDGATVRLTIDMALQDIVESEMNAAMKQFRPKMAATRGQYRRNDSLI